MFTPTEGQRFIYLPPGTYGIEENHPSLPSINPSVTTCGQSRRAGANGRGTEKLASLKLTSFVLVCK